jgi:hypothetical protein
MKKEEWNGSEEPGLKDGRIISSSACMCDGWWSSCWLSFYLIHINHLIVLFATMSGFLCSPLHCTNYLAGAWWMFLYMWIYILSFRGIAVVSPLVLTWTSSCFIFISWGCRFYGMPFLFCRINCVLNVSCEQDKGWCTCK